MSCLGVLFAVPEDVVKHIRALPMAQRPEYISDELEEEYFEEYPERTAELDKRGTRSTAVLPMERFRLTAKAIRLAEQFSAASCFITTGISTTII